MKTILVTTTYLIPAERFDKTVKFINHYRKRKPEWHIHVMDNNSPQSHTDALWDAVNVDSLTHFGTHFDRPSLLDYKYLWRAVWHLQDEFLYGDYDKIIYMDNDFFALSDDMFDYIEKLESGWTTFWTPMFGFPETGCHVIVKGCKEYEDFVAGTTMEEFIARHNGGIMENILPVTHIEKNMIGDRYGEYSPENKPVPEGVDFWAQAQLDERFD